MKIKLASRAAVMTVCFSLCPDVKWTNFRALCSYFPWSQSLRVLLKPVGVSAAVTFLHAVCSTLLLFTWNAHGNHCVLAVTCSRILFSAIPAVGIGPSQPSKHARSDLGSIGQKRAGWFLHTGLLPDHIHLAKTWHNQRELNWIRVGFAQYYLAVSYTHLTLPTRFAV